MKGRKIELNKMDMKNKKIWITLIELVITILVSYDEKINSRLYRNVKRKIKEKYPELSNISINILN